MKNFNIKALAKVVCVIALISIVNFTFTTTAIEADNATVDTENDSIIETKEIGPAICMKRYLIATEENIEEIQKVFDAVNCNHILIFDVKK